MKCQHCLSRLDTEPLLHMLKELGFEPDTTPIEWSTDHRESPAEVVSHMLEYQAARLDVFLHAHGSDTEGGTAYGELPKTVEAETLWFVELLNALRAMKELLITGDAGAPEDTP